MLESTLKQKFNKLLAKEYNVEYFNIQDKFNGGIPDTYFYHKGTSTWVEYKVKYNKPTKLQLHRLKTLAKQGIPVAVLTYKKGEYILDALNDDDELELLYKTDNIKEMAEWFMGMWGYLSLRHSSLLM